MSHVEDLRAYRAPRSNQQRLTIFLIVAGEFLRPTGELATFIVSTVALLVILFFPNGFLGSALAHGARQ